MKYILLVFIGLFLSSCGHIWMQGYFPDPEFRPYVQGYKDVKAHYTGSGSTNKYITVQFDNNIPNKKIGGCFSFTGSNVRQIVVDPKEWKKMSETNRFILILHEMGHCDLDLTHCRCTGIMQEDHLGEYIFNTNQEFYLEQLFLKGK